MHPTQASCALDSDLGLPIIQELDQDRGRGFVSHLGQDDSSLESTPQREAAAETGRLLFHQPVSVDDPGEGLDLGPGHRVTEVDDCIEEGAVIDHLRVDVVSVKGKGHASAQHAQEGASPLVVTLHALSVHRLQRDEPQKQDCVHSEDDPDRQECDLGSIHEIS